jgi:hypothetical protein
VPDAPSAGGRTLTPTEKAHEFLSDIAELTAVASNRLANGDGDEFFDCIGTMKNKLSIIETFYINDQL